jgi:choline/glycine/proline betaine transport protein
MQRLKLNPPVAIVSLLVVGLLLVYAGFWPEEAGRVFLDAQGWMLDAFGWVYVTGVAIFLFACLYFALSRYGRIKLGPDDSEPDFSFAAWTSMLFAAGMGVGLMFYGVAEPMAHYTSPPTGEGGTVSAQEEAMVSTFFHWGVTAWAIFGIVGLSLAYFGYRYNLPLTVRSGLYPLLKDRIHGPIGDAVDIFAIVGTMFGIATSLGVGVMQMNSGLNYVFDVPVSSTVQVVIIFSVMAVASVSVVAGLDKGVRRLSEVNLIMAMVLMLFVLFVGPTLYVLNALLQNTGMYIDALFPRTIETFAYEPNQWFKDWTLYYWAWWISWSPFVGMFMARISRGRTIREFILGVLLVPTALTAVWMTVFGNTAFWLDTGKADGAIGAAVEANIDTALFEFLGYFPWPTATSILSIFLIAIFFITGADSGALVVDTMASGGEEETPAFQRLFWCFLMAAIAAVLLVAGGLEAMQAATTASALPFVLIVVVLCIGLNRGLSADQAGRVLLRQRQAAPQFVGAAPMSWRSRLHGLIQPPRDESVRQYMVETVRTAMDKVATEFKSRGFDAEVRQGEDEISLVVPVEGARNYVYGVRLKSAPLPGFVLGGVDTRATAQRRIWAAVTYFFDGRRGYNIMGYSQDQVITDILDQYEIYRRIARAPQTELYVTSPDATSGDAI